MVVEKMPVGTGRVTYWTLAEWTDGARLKSEWGPLGLDELVPEPRRPVSCLKDALEEVFGSRDVLIRPLAARTGFTVVRETKGEDGNQYLNLFTARCVEGQGDPTFTNLTDEVPVVVEAFRKYQGRVTAAQVGRALADVVMKRVGGTRLRPSGGVYWVPGRGTGDWEAAAAALERAAVGGRSVCYQLDVDLDANAVIAVRDAIVREVADETRRLAEELRSGELGPRAVETRKGEAAALRRKVVEYERILGVGLDALKQGLDSVEQSHALATILESALATPFADAVPEREFANACLA
jgi:hypothetical protein